MKRTTAWCLYDWANSAFVTTIVAAVLPIYFESVICGSSDVHWSFLGLGVTSSPAALWGYAMALAALMVALLSPVLGAAADAGGRRKHFLAALTCLGVVCSLLLGLTGAGQVWATLLLLVLGQIGFAGANVFYNSLLVIVAIGPHRDTISARGYAFGYLGGGLLLALNLVLIRSPGLLGLENEAAASRVSFIS
ncbi:MFS transporter, partial [Candidatus Fermentibacterales bacterium]|nr:MFS transporter [Candidatus Fermentibacterales bacterium]